MNINDVFRLNKGGVGKSRLQTFILSWIHGYNHLKYWKRRSIVIDSANKTNILLKVYYLFWIKRVDARHHCSFGTRLNSGAQFITPPYLPHRPNGIIVGHDAIVGKEVIIYHQVTIAGGKVVIGDHSKLGAGAKILP